MEISSAQREVRTVFRGGAIGQAVSGFLWLVSAVLATWVSQTAGMAALFLSGFLIYPLTQLSLKLAGGPASLSKENKLSQLATQVAFVIPLCLPVIAAATLRDPNWFYPAFMVVVGAHYLPFVFLYGMWQFAVLTALLVGGGVLIGMVLPNTFTLGGWVTAGVLILFAVVVGVTRAWER